MNRKIIILVVVMLLLSLGTSMAFDFQPMAYQYLRTGYTSLYDYGNRTLLLIGETEAKQPVNTIEVTIILQQYRNGAWVNVWSDTATRLNSLTSYIQKDVSVQGGYHYRLYGIHNVTHNGVSETNYTYTGSKYVN